MPRLSRRQCPRQAIDDRRFVEREGYRRLGASCPQGFCRAAARSPYDARERIRIREQARREIDDSFETLPAREELPELPAIRGGHPLVRHHEAEPLRDPMRELDE